MNLLRVATPAGRWVIAATVLGSGMAAIDATVVGIALPSIGREFHATVGALQWVVTGYTMSLAALLLLGGSLGDLYGRRRIFCIGVVWFTVASLACAGAPDSTALVLMRILQGVGAALLTPGSLAILQASFEPDERGRAIGAWSGLGGVATAFGPLLGGYLVAVASWRWIFVINAPIGVAVLLLSVRHVPETRDPRAQRHVDAAGAGLAMVALAGMTFGLIEGPGRGWGAPAVVAALVVGALAFALFLFVEWSSPAPMLPLSVFGVRQFTVTNAVTFIVYAALGGALFLLPIELQVVDHYSPLEAGLSLLPLTAIMLALSARSGRLAARIGPRLQMSVGPAVMGGGMAMLARSTTDAFYPTGVLPAMVVFGLGLATTVAPLTATALGAVSAEHSGLASAVNNDVARLGGLIAVAVLPALAGITGTSYLHPDQLATGFRTAIAVAAACCVAGGVLAAVGIRNPAPAPPAGEGAAALAHAYEPAGSHYCALEAAPLASGDRG